MNIEDYREYCLSLGEDIEEKLPFQKFKNGEGVLVFLLQVLVSLAIEERGLPAYFQY